MPNICAKRFDWWRIAPITPNLPSTGGELRTRLEDFIVIEVPRYQPNGEGQHSYAFIEKRGIATQELVGYLKTLGVPTRNIGVAGRKDKFAVARQWISVPKIYESQLTELEAFEGVRILELSRYKQKLRIGNLLGNRFEIRVRNPSSDWESRAHAILDALVDQGLPNYFGPQRFGNQNDNVLEGFRMLGKPEFSVGSRLEKFLMSSVQSHLFNWTLNSRINAGLYCEVLKGDWAQKHSTGGMFVVEDPIIESRRAKTLEISAALPMHGRKVHCSQGQAGAMQRDVLDYFRLSRDAINSLGSGTWRISRVPINDYALDSHIDGYSVSFFLPKGSYATILLRELVQPRPV